MYRITNLTTKGIRLMAKKTKEESDIFTQALKDRLKCPTCKENRWIYKGFVMCPEHPKRDEKFTVEELRKLRKLFPELNSTPGRRGKQTSRLIDGYKKQGSYTNHMEASDEAFFAARDERQD